MGTNDIGYNENPKNGHNIIRARTLKQIRSWEFPRNEKALEILNIEFGKLPFPGLYILFEGKSKVYIGESKNIYNRLKTHTKKPENKISKWHNVLIISDGRPASQSDFNDNVVRLSLESYLIDLFKANKYTVVAQGEPQICNPAQSFLVNSLIVELNFFLKKKNYISKTLENKNEQEVFGDTLKKLFEQQGKTIKSWNKYDAIIDGEKVFIRSGSKKPSGWQITFRGRKPGSFINSLQKGNGSLLISRGKLILIPLKKVQLVITDKSTYDQDTIDIWIKFSDDKTTLRYKKNEIEVQDYFLL